jgi:hypothetical protein
MVPGITDTECRIKQLRYREMHAEAERQRLAATTCAQIDRAGVTQTLQSRIGALMKRAGQLRQSVRTREASEHAATPGTLAVGR